jgi:methylenetetrahydrofolate reductase (NADPH)
MHEVEEISKRSTRADIDALAPLLHGASIEMNVTDVGGLEASRACLPRGQTVYISHLPRQRWADTAAACRAAHAAGFRPVPHLPVRLLDGASTLDDVLRDLTESARVDEVLLIAGDSPRAAGPYASVADVLESGALTRCGLRRISFAGHPEGHPQVALTDIRRAEREKAALASAAGFEATFLTQFFFEAAPFLAWCRDLRAHGVRARIVASLSGPAPIHTLFRYAVRCGVGPSIRALSARPGSVLKLAGGHAPDALLEDLATARVRDATLFDGVHWFSFGGFLRTCEWLAALRARRAPRSRLEARAST